MAKPGSAHREVGRAEVDPPTVQQWRGQPATRRPAAFEHPDRHSGRVQCRCAGRSGDAGPDHGNRVAGLWFHSLIEPHPPTRPPMTAPDIVRRLRAAGCVFAEDEARAADRRGRLARRAGAAGRAPGRRAAAGALLGWAEFCGLRIAVEPGVFVPRRRTELLVRRGRRPVRPGAVVLDLCCGSGAIGAALAARVPGRGARRGPRPGRGRLRPAQPGRPGGQVFEGDLYDAAARRRCAAGSTCWSPTRRTCRPGRSR